MDTVESIEARTARDQATNKAGEIVRKLASMFRCDSQWIEDWVPSFRSALVGDGAKPRLTAHQIQMAFDELIDTWKSPKTVPLPAHILEKGKQYVTQPKPKAQHRPAEKPQERQWTDATANIAKVDEILAYCARQNEDPEYAEALMTHGKGSPELKAVVDRQRAEMQAWLRH